VSQLIDDYELLNCLATGNISQIWEVKQVSTSQTLAMKILLPETLKESEHKSALKHEIVVAKSVDHPNIIRLVDSKLSKTNAYFVMEYFRAPNLKSMLRSDLTGARMRLKRIMECVTQALAHMHEKGWVHRDIKPDNILVNKGSEVRIIDFALSAHPKSMIGKLLSSKRRTVIQGTRTYLAPELIERKPLSISADIYSLGVTFYEVLTGRPPFVSGNPNELLMAHVRDTPEKPSGYNENVSPECDLLVMSMLAKKPEKRPGSMQEVFAAIRNMKFFKGDVEEMARAAAEAAEDKFSKSMAARLDSRTDAGRSDDERAEYAAETKRLAEIRKKQREIAERKAKKKEGGGDPMKAPAAQPGAPAPMPSYPMPGYGMPMPGMPMPGMPMPGMGIPVPGMPMPGMPMPGYPFPPGGFPPPGYGGPPGAMPGMPPAAVPPQGAQPGRPASGQPAPATPAKPAAPAAPVKRPPPPAKPDLDDIPLMDELPDVL
jgi:serine/threonine-protein kinase